MNIERYKQIHGEGYYQMELFELREIVQEKVRMLSEYRKLPVTHPEYINDHRLYLQLEHDCDEAIYQYLLRTGKGRLGENGKYF